MVRIILTCLMNPSPAEESDEFDITSRKGVYPRKGIYFQGRVPPEGPPPFLNFSGGSGGNFCKLPGESRLMGLASRPQKPAEYLLLFPE